METKSDTVDLSAHLPALLFSLSAKIARHASRESARPLGFDMCEWRVIQILGRDGPSSVNEIADRITMDRGGTSRAISRLEAKGIVARSSDPADRRRSTVALTDVGRDAHIEIAAFANWREATLAAELSASETATLTHLLDRLDRRIDEMPVTPAFTETKSA